MGKLEEIRKKLVAGSTAKQLIEQGYAKSSVFNVAKKLKGSQPNIPDTTVSDELQELRHQKEVLKLQNEIASLEADKEKLPERLATLEKTVLEVRSLLYNAVDTAIAVCLEYAGMDREEAKEYADGWVVKNIKG